MSSLDRKLRAIIHSQEWALEATIFAHKIAKTHPLSISTVVLNLTKNKFNGRTVVTEDALPGVELSGHLTVIYTTIAT